MEIRLSFLLVMTVIFTVPFLLWRLGRTNGYAPLVVIQILVGILLGPGVLGRTDPDFFMEMLNPKVLFLLKGVAWWGVMCFVMLTGLELDLRASWAHRKEALTTAGLALIVPFALCAMAAAPLSQNPAWIGSNSQPWQFSTGVGMACSVTALPILTLFLQQMGILGSPLGQRVLRFASVDDLVLWTILAFVLIDWNRLLAQFGFFLGFIPAGLTVRLCMRRLEVSDRWYAALIWLTVCALAAEYAGLHFTVGAFLAGASLDLDWFDRARVEQMRASVLFFMMPVFFLLTGLQTEWNPGESSILTVAGVLLFLSVLGKLTGVFLAGKMLGWRRGEAAIIGWLLQTKALIMILFSNVLLDRSIITERMFSVLLLVALISTALTMPMVRLFGCEALREGRRP